MLILIAGITGNLGQYLAQAAITAGHTVRGLGRNPSKLPSSISSQLESFITSKSYDDIPALDAACIGADAIICSYAANPILSLDGQLLLLRAAERAGITRFHAASWNIDWSEFPLGTLETYDAYISFYHHARLTSPIKPLYVFTGVLAKTFFAVPGAGALESDKSFWARTGGKNRRINVIGTGEEVFDWCSEADAAAFSVALVTSDCAEEGGFYRFCSQSFSLKELRETYLRVHPEAEVEWFVVPVSVEQFEGMVKQKRKDAIEQGKLRELYREFVGFVYVVLMVRQDCVMKKTDEGKFPGVKRTSLEEYIRTEEWV